MNDVHIHRFRACYRLPAGARGERRRLDRILADRLGSALDEAIGREHFAEEEEVCIRRLTVPVRLRIGQSDAALATDWGEAVAQAIRRARAEGEAGRGAVTASDTGASVLWFRSRGQAVVEFSAAVARGDSSRVWAWRQLGLWQGGDAAGGDEARREWVQAMAREPGWILPVLRQLTEVGTMTRLAERLEPRHWLSLASAAVQHAAVPLTWRELQDPGGAVERGPAGEVVSDVSAAAAGDAIPDEPAARADGANGGLGSRGDWETAERTAARVWERSVLARVFRELPEAARNGVRRALAALLVLEAEPAWAARTAPAWRELLRVVAERPEWERRARSARPRTSVSDANAGTDRTSGTTEAASPSARGTAGAPPNTGPGGRPSGEPMDNPEGRSPSAPPEAPAIDPRRRATTRLGGLMYLVNLLPEVGFPECLAEEFPDQPAQWVLHRLGLRLTGTVADDPALLAFAGLPPGSSVPEPDGEPDVEESRRLNERARRIVEKLEERLEGYVRPGESVLEKLCHREAEVIADPGWIVVRFRLADVSTEVRRAGLDRNPDFVPWLGVVVRFVYE